MGIIKKFASLQKLWYIAYDEGDQGSQTGESLMQPIIRVCLLFYLN